MLSYRAHFALLDGSQVSSVEGSTWGRAQMQKDYKSVSSVQPMVKSAVGSMASKRKISEDEDDASDSEKMVICEDESAGNG